MPGKTLKPGDLIKALIPEWVGLVGIVTKPITEERSGHVLLIKDGVIMGVDAAMDDVESADEGSEGFAQLGYQLIKLGSQVIEKKLLVYHT